MKWTKIIKKKGEQIEAGIYPGASLRILRTINGRRFYLARVTQSMTCQTEAGLVYDLASVSKVVGVGTVLPSCGKRSIRY